MRGLNYDFNAVMSEKKNGKSLIKSDQINVIPALFYFSYSVYVLNIQY